MKHEFNSVNVQVNHKLYLIGLDYPLTPTDLNIIKYKYNNA